MGKLTAKKVQSLKTIGMYNDGGGLYLRVTPPNGKSWVLKTRVRGKVREIGLGGADVTSLAEAREEALRLRKIARSGGDPLAERQHQKQIPTFIEAARTVHDIRKASWKNGKHSDNWLSTLENHAAPTLGHLPIDQIDTTDILRVLTPIWHTKKETARRVRQRMATIFDWAKTSGFYSRENPVSALGSALGSQAMKVENFAALPWRELPEFFAQLAQREGTAALALQFLILTAGRSGEIRGATWAEMDTEARTWTIPAERMKGGREHRVPLSDQAIAVLENVLGLHQELVFPSPQRKQLSENSFRMLLQRMDRSDITAHGFRSTFRQWCQESRRVDHDIAEACLAHRVGNKVSQAYARSDLFDGRVSVMDAWGSYSSRFGAEEVVQILGFAS
jgi:integrase